MYDTAGSAKIIAEKGLRGESSSSRSACSHASALYHRYHVLTLFEL
jgi:hypothetical protein